MAAQPPSGYEIEQLESHREKYWRKRLAESPDGNTLVMRRIIKRQYSSSDYVNIYTALANVIVEEMTSRLNIIDLIIPPALPSDDNALNNLYLSIDHRLIAWEIAQRKAPDTSAAVRSSKIALWDCMIPLPPSLHARYGSARYLSDILSAAKTMGMRALLYQKVEAAEKDLLARRGKR